MDYFDKADLAITICDKEGKIIEMNEQSRAGQSQTWAGSHRVKCLDCHPEPARSMLKKMMEEEGGKMSTQ